MTEHVVRRRRFTVAAVQAAPVVFNREATIAKGVRLIAEAASNGAAIVAFPETWISGYPAWIYGAAGWDNPASKRTFRRMQESAVSVPSSATQELCTAAARHGVEVVMGINERDAQFSTGTLYNSMLFISQTGEIRGVHRKLLPTHAERIVWGQGDGSTLHVFDTDFGRIGGLICWEHWMPLPRFAMHAKGEQIHIASWPEVPDIHQLASRHYAFEGRCFVICAGTYLTVAVFPDDFELHEALSASGDFGGEKGVLIPGGSGIIGPDGSWISGPVEGEAIVYGEIDLDRLGEEQLALDSAGHYNRPDIFQLTVDERPHRQVTWLRNDAEAELSRMPDVFTSDA
jgi:nitrilase